MRIVFLTIIILLLLGLGGREFMSQEIAFQDKIYPGISINGKEFGGKTKEEVNEFFRTKNKNLKELWFTIVYDKTPIATLSGEMLNLGYSYHEVLDRAYLVGRSGNFWRRSYEKMMSLAELRKFPFRTGLRYDRKPVLDVLSQTKEANEKPAKNALFKFENGKVISFRQEEKGLKIRDEQFLQTFKEMIMELEKEIGNRALTLHSSVVEPEITLAKANNFGIEEFLAEGKSDFSHSIPERIHNIILATSKFEGVLIPKGESFSFNGTIGDISSYTGYKPAYIIKAGKTVLGDGGGVCQVSTTLFRAALNAGLPIVERTAHAYRVGYYENDSKPGFDATVFSPYVDLKIRNDTPASILIQTEIDKENNLLYFRFFGKKDTRRIEISPVTVYDVVSPLPEMRQDDPTLKKGVVKQVDFPAWGAKAIFSYKVTRGGGEVSFEKKFLSVYRPWAAVYLVGTSD